MKDLLKEIYLPKKLFFIQTEDMTWLEIIGWWEERRLAYNWFVAANGVTGFVLLILLASLPPSSETRGNFFPEPMLIFAAPILVPLNINIAYTFGWIVNRFLYPLFPAHQERIGPILMRLGVGFSLLVMYIMPFISSIFWVGEVFFNLGPTLTPEGSRSNG